MTPLGPEPRGAWSVTRVPDFLAVAFSRLWTSRGRRLQAVQELQNCGGMDPDPQAIGGKPRTVARSSVRILTEYDNQSSPSTFVKMSEKTPEVRAQPRWVVFWFGPRIVIGYNQKDGDLKRRTEVA